MRELLIFDLSSCDDPARTKVSRAVVTSEPVPFLLWLKRCRQGVAAGRGCTECISDFVLLTWMAWNSYSLLIFDH